MKLLAIETATEACSAALLIDDQIELRYEIKPRGHSELILSMMDELLGEAGLSANQLDAMAFGRGPGSFTGVRIATGVIQGAAFAADLPVVPVSTLAALAQRAYREKGEPNLLTAFDARMGELYWAGYRVDSNDIVRLVLDEQVANAQQVHLPLDEEWYGVGSGWSAYAPQLGERLGESLLGYKADLYCSARDVATLAAVDFEAGLAVPAERALPVYLRNDVAHKKR
ncbi:MAG: tRNA (adenosine(37)-N6)-threonylcarbamoyltransferase complex dimerization subunit type 1 TsaB [Candidatus Thiodiazotropha weberae]|uniref:tRNA threonylcarbamoyladenosine biosynthesis protein TsaB n=1 Tax=Candidatus Thiodiazotropha endoloripes TaxID=1818881 RepID=A0A1E2UPT6_9GAMM|nr:tRNA (adenosine(37)-N6)-threonylcarbamoyltransferase complex dimerization subunit type 1 TsaB [Candidatus Thiodiazotropha endoloripes]MCG7898224.1 tRNA (adenosine(37)-N6)-threonylcarbamoyltransferase complex dimerization subunit type 1 TsaB [Candidatus Thiodiazotropha weberae]MCG7912818.1 tRNA (adenosine(37)-N6)-threonylcarbamoyltransferase complex dimerization subunit type 1 TsaB [Candidatus Thiodiazotropha weberae]ODB96770.1 tRNA N6-adenosine(37)-N6-threonylcarbamoyltransferase complex dime